MTDAIYITEGHPRGMASNIICLLGALRTHPEKQIVLVPPFMSLYAADGLNGFPSFFSSLGRILVADNKAKVGDAIDMGSYFPLPSYDADVATNGDATRKAIEELAIVYNREMRLSDDCREAIRARIKTVKSVGRWSISIHRRATDHSMHTRILSKEDFALRASRHVAGEKNVFVASDETDFFSVLSLKTSSRVLFTDAERSSSFVGTHFLPSSESIRVRRGIDVLLDIICLSHSRIILCGASGIPVVSCIMNPSCRLQNIVGERWS